MLKTLEKRVFHVKQNGRKTYVVFFTKCKNLKFCTEKYTKKRRKIFKKTQIVNKYSKNKKNTNKICNKNQGAKIKARKSVKMIEATFLKTRIKQ